MTTPTAPTSATAAPQPATDPRIAIWSLSARVIGAYFVLFLVQYAPGVALEASAHWPSAEATALELARAALHVVKASGPIGLGSATNALAIAITVEAIMVLAKIISMHQREEGFRQGVEQGIEQGVQQGIEQERKRSKRERKRRDAELRALAEQYGIPEDALPLADVDDTDDVDDETA